MLHRSIAIRSVHAMKPDVQEFVKDVLNDALGKLFQQDGFKVSAVIEHTTAGSVFHLSAQRLEQSAG